MSVELLPTAPRLSQTDPSSSIDHGPSATALVIAAILSVVIPFGVVATSFLLRVAAARIAVAAALGLFTLVGPLVGIGLATFAIVRSRARRAKPVLAVAILGLLLNLSFLVAIVYRAASLNAHGRRGHASARPAASPIAHSSCLAPVV